MMAGSLFGLLILFIVVVLPLAAGIALLVLSRRGGLGYPACGACKYNLSATVGTVDRCPECGAMFVDAGILPPRGKRKPLLIWLGVALIVLPLGCVGLFSWTVSQTMSQSLTRARAAAAQAKQQALAAQQAQQQAGSESDPEPQTEAETPAPDPEAESVPEPAEQPESE